MTTPPVSSAATGSRTTGIPMIDRALRFYRSPKIVSLGRNPESPPSWLSPDNGHVAAMALRGGPCGTKGCTCEVLDGD